MAKSKAKIEIEAKEKGVKMVQKGVENLASSSKKAGKEAENLAKNAATVDKNIKGAAGASANATKNFSKMQQGMGGLVGVYASFAAQIFAISAAFNFLKSAGDLQTLGASQQAYAANTGLAMRVLADDIIAATGAQISYQEASQAAAIGTSAGLSPDQLRRLGSAAKDLSVTLGRDVTDSFNRLVRGVTKAEPELLDELGIILRLEDAQREYALSIGKTASDLTQFEKSQAVVNKVLQEADKVAANAPDAINVYNQLGKAFDDILNNIKTLVGEGLEPLAKVFIKTPQLAIASFGLLLKGPLSALGLNFKKITEAATENATAARASAEKIRASYAQSKLTIESTTAAVKAQSQAFIEAGSKSKLVERLATGGAITPQGMATLKRSLKAALLEHQKSGQVTKGIWVGVSRESLLAYQLMLEQMELAEKDKVTGTAKNVSKIAALWAGASAGVQTLGAGILSIGTKLLSLVSWVGLAVTAFLVLKEIFGWFEDEGNEAAEEAARALEAQRERVKDLNKEYKDFFKTQQQLAAVGRAREIGGNVGTMLGMQSSDDFSATVRQAAEFQQAQNRINELQAQKEALGPVTVNQRGQRVNTNASRLNAIRIETDALAKSIEEGGLDQAGEYIQRISDSLTLFEKAEGGQFTAFKELLQAMQNPENAEGLEAARVKAQELGSKISEMPQLFKNSDDALGSFIQQFAPMTEGQRAISEMKLEMQALNDIAAERESGNFTGEEALRYSKLAKNVKIIAKWEDRIKESKLAQIALDQEKETALANVDKLLAPVLEKNYEIRQLERDRNALTREKADLESVSQIEGSDEAKATADRIELIVAELGLINNRIELREEENTILQQQRDIQLEIRKLNNEIRSLDLEKQRLKMLEDEVKIQGELLKLEQEKQEIEGARARRDFDRRTLFSSLGQELAVAEEAYQREANLLKAKLDQVDAEFDIKKQIIELENKLLVAKLKVSEQELKNQAAGERDLETKQNLLAAADATGSLAALQQESLSGQLILLEAQREMSKLRILDNLDKLRYARDNLTEIAELTKTIEDSIYEGFNNLFNEMVNGTQSFTDAFRRMTIAVLEDITRMIVKMLVLKAIQVATGTGGAPVGGLPPANAGNAAWASFYGARTGGIMSNGKMMTGYASGGIASGSTSGYPAMLHGTEAIVPLPNGRSIPVEMSGSSQQNNVTVNVSVDNQGNSSQQISGDGAGTMGRLIAAAVQKELQNQKRSGGILSPFGVA